MFEVENSVAKEAPVGLFDLLDRDPNTCNSKDPNDESGIFSGIHADPFRPEVDDEREKMSMGKGLAEGSLAPVEVASGVPLSVLALSGPSTSKDLKMLKGNEPIVDLDDARALGWVTDEGQSSDVHDTASSEIPQTPAPLREISEVGEWSPERVSEWLLSAGLGVSIVTILNDHGVNGYMLLLLSDQKLIEMGIHIPTARALILTAVDELTGQTHFASSTTTVASASSSLAEQPPQYC
ncbi:hypothetical protein HDU67_008345 [Dinochytrium kinnereticum]|nr:hypothetical protein HDU67_008345 [Dinochytrium kinnereticum]